MKGDRSIVPRILRMNAAPGYLGMCIAEFNNTVRPFVREFPIGIQGVGFDRYELGDWADQYIATHAVDKSADRAGGTAGGLRRAEERRKKRAKLEFQQALEAARRNR